MGELVPPQQGRRTDKEPSRDSAKFPEHQRLSEFRKPAEIPKGRALLMIEARIGELAYKVPQEQYPGVPRGRRDKQAKPPKYERLGMSPKQLRDAETIHSHPKEVAEVIKEAEEIGARLGVDRRTIYEMGKNSNLGKISQDLGPHEAGGEAVNQILSSWHVLEFEPIYREEAEKRRIEIGKQTGRGHRKVRADWPQPLETGKSRAFMARDASVSERPARPWGLLGVFLD